MTPEQRKSIDNAIWCCANHGTHVDRDVTSYTVERLRTFKADHEAAVARSIGTAQDPSVHEAEIDEARDLMRRGELAIAREKLERKRTRDWDKLSARQRYRVLANLGAIADVSGKAAQAAALFVEAATFQPDEADARAYCARAMELGGGTEEAFEAASELLEAHACKRAAPIFVRCAPATLDFSAIEARVRLWLGEQDVLVALVIRAINSRALDAALRLARRLTAENPDLALGPLLLGKTLFIREAENFHAANKAPVRALDQGALSEAEDALTLAVAKALAGEPEVSADALLVRAQVRAFLERPEEAEKDLEAAQRLQPTGADVLVTRSMYLPMSQAGRAIQLLRDAIQQGGGTRARFLLATRLAEAAHGSREALDLLSEVAALDPFFADEATGVAFEILVREARLTEAEEAVRKAQERDACLGITLAGQFALHKGTDEIARGLARQAFELSKAEPRSAATRRRLAALLMAVGELRAALELWKGLASLDFDSPDLRRLLDCAYQLRDDALLLETCKRLRTTGVWEPQLIELEAGLLDRYDPEQGYELLRAYIARKPDDRRATLRFSYAAVRTGRLKEAICDRGRLPDAAQGGVENGVATVRLLGQVVGQEEALAHAYDLLRAYWNDGDANLCFLRTMLEAEPSLPAKPEVAGPGAAVRYREVGTAGPERWIVLEEGPVIYPALDEVPPTSERGAKFVGLRPGDHTKVVEGIQDREAEVLEVTHKYRRRYQDCIDQFQVRFPGRSELHTFTIGEEGLSPDVRFAPMLKVADIRAAHVADVLEKYRLHPLSLACLSNALDRDPITCQVELAKSPTLRVRANVRPKAAHDESVRAMGTVNDVIVDVSAIGTILALGIVDEVKAWGWPLSVSYATKDLLEGFVKRHAEHREAGFLRGGPGGYAFEAVDTAKWKALSEAARTILAIVSVVPAAALASMELARRKELGDLHDQWGSETICAAMTGSRAIWSDDATVVVTAQENGVLAVGTQGIAQAAVARGVLLPSRAAEVAAMLVGFGYEATWLDSPLVEAACRLSDYRPASEPLAALMALVARDEFAMAPATSLALVCLKSISENVVLPESRTAAHIAVLEAAAKRRDSAIVLSALEVGVRRILGVNVLRGDELTATIRTWRAQRG